MILVIGGKAQGKTEYVKKKYPDRECFDDFHEWFRNSMLAGKEPEKEAAGYIKSRPDAVIIAQEVGSGIVPMDKFEREYRERLGRCLVNIAESSDRVIRIFCGMETVLK